MDETITIVLGSVGPVYDRGLLALLEEEPDLHVTTVTLHLGELEAAVLEHSPHVAILGQRHLIEPRVLRRFAEIRPGIGIVALTTRHLSEALLIQLIALGANACLPEHAPWADLLTAVRYAAEGKGMWAQASNVAGEVGPSGAILTNREKEVLELVQRDMKNREIANQLHISVGTVEKHLKHIRQKLGVARRWALIA
jgi:DNA-binding NarL/FixJ family response regulator